MKVKYDRIKYKNLKKLVRQKGDCNGILCTECYYDSRWRCRCPRRLDKLFGEAQRIIMQMESEERKHKERRYANGHR